MTFDALTIAGLLSGLSAGVFVALANVNDQFRRRRRRAPQAAGRR